MLRTQHFAAVSLGVALAAVCLACGHSIGRDPGSVAAAYAAAGRYPEATREIEMAIRAHPRDLGLRQQAARIYGKSGEPARAIGHLEVAIQIAPGDAESWIHLGQLENGRENVSDAYVAYRRAAELAPDQIRAVSGLALAADSLGFTDEAEEAYARWAELERDQQTDSIPQRED